MTRFEKLTLLFALLALAPPAIAFYVDYIIKSDYRSWVNFNFVSGEMHGITECCVYFVANYEIINKSERPFNFRISQIYNSDLPVISHGFGNREFVNSPQFSRMQVKYYFYIDFSDSFSDHIRSVWEKTDENDMVEWRGRKFLTIGNDGSLDLLRLSTKGNYFRRLDSGGGEGVNWIKGSFPCSAMINESISVEDPIGGCLDIAITADEGFSLRAPPTWIGAYRWAFYSTPVNPGIEWAPKYWREK